MGYLWKIDTDIPKPSTPSAPSVPFNKLWEGYGQNQGETLDKLTLYAKLRLLHF